MKVKCSKCGTTVNYDPVKWRCGCGEFWEIVFSPVVDIPKIKNRDRSMWRYEEVLPLKDPEKRVSLRETMTPLVEDSFRKAKVLLKLENNMPSGSFKDRGAALMISVLKANGVKKVIEDSSGNAGCSVALYAAKASIDCTVFVPMNADEEKVRFIKSVGGDVEIVHGSREDTAEAVLKAAEKTCYASHVWNPWFIHGVKTCAYEISEQSGWSSPSRIFLPAGNGTLLLGLHKGFTELVEAGVLLSTPQLIPVQSGRCCPLYDAFHKRKPAEYTSSIAKGISVSAPPRLQQMVAAVESSNGTVISVSEDDIRSAQAEMRSSGYYIDPASAAGMAGFSSCLVKTGALVIITGSLKKVI